MQRSRSAESGEHEIAWIVAALHGDDLENFRHRVVDDVDDGGRSRAHIDSKRLGEPGTDGSRRGRMINRKLSVEQRPLGPNSRARGCSP